MDANDYATKPDQHPPQSTYYEEFSIFHDESQPDEDTSPIPESSAASIPNNGSARYCRWCQRPFLRPGELEEHESTTEPVRRSEGNRISFAKTESRDEILREHNVDVSKVVRQTLDSSSPNKDRGLIYTGGNVLEGQMDVADIIKKRPHHHAVLLSRNMAKGKYQNSGDSDSEDDDLGDLAGSQQFDSVTSLYGTSMPKASFFGSFSHRGRPKAPVDSWKKSLSKSATPRSFQTAQSSLASYTTASSGSPSVWQTDTNRSSRYNLTTKVSQGAHEDLVGIVVTRILSYILSSAVGFSQKEKTKFDNFIALGLSPIFQIASENILNLQYKKQIGAYVHELVGQLVSYKVRDNRQFDLDHEMRRSTLRKDITTDILCFLEKRTRYGLVATTGKVFSSEWLDHLRTRGILLDPVEELDWSGKGQHVEYSPEDEKEIPLMSEKILGHSQTAIVDSVRCRRIRLARKKIVCNRRLRKEDAVIEVEHLLRLQHAHIVRVFGTYTLKKDLAILLYPAAEWDLDAYMDELSDGVSSFALTEVCSVSAMHTLTTFFGCLSNAMAFIHERNVKHMDIKPKNILVRRTRGGLIKVYIADFGIARSYKSAADSETDSPVSFTRTYAAPQVVLQDRRGFSADIFSLGCVFVEIMATLRSLSTDACDERQKLLELRQNNSGNSAYYANIDAVTQWYKDTIMTELVSWKYGVLGAQTRIVELCPQMISEASNLRPVYSKLKEDTVGLACLGCNAGPEAFEAAD
jgi:serine/threonine protein kinase